MTIPFEALQGLWEVFLLVFVRMTGIFVMSPIFGRRTVPAILKIGLAFLMALIVCQNVRVPDMASFGTLSAWILLGMREFLVGLALGFIAYAVTAAMYVAGQLIDMRIGFGMVNVFDPVSNIQVPITADFYIVLTTLFLMLSDGHLLMLHTLALSYEKLPLGTLAFTEPALEQMIRLMASIFEIGFRIAMPVTVAILVTDMALGIISKSVPQMNVFMLGMPVKILLGLVMLLVTLTSFRGIVDFLLEGTWKEMDDFLRSARG